MNFISDAERAQIAKKISKAALPALNQREREYTQKLTSILSVQRETILHFNEQIEKASDAEVKKQLEMELQYSLSLYETQIKNLSRT